MDDRGRELQQVETGSRFWWRALDAQTPVPVLSSMPDATDDHLPQTSHVHSQAHAHRPHFHLPHFHAPRPLPQSGLTLQIPRSDRRKQPRRSKSRARTGVLIALALTSVAGAGAVLAATASPTLLSDLRQNIANAATRALIASGFGIDQVSLTGQRYTLDADVFDALDLSNVKTFAALDTAAALKRIERIAWVETAQITRVFPGVLNVQIKERTPAAIWTRGDKTYLIDVTGRTLGPVAAKNSWPLPHISGEGANADAPLLLASIRRHKAIADNFSHAERIAERRWSIVLKNASRIELGADREVEGLDQVASNTVLRTALLESATSVDVRTAGRAVLRALAQSSPAPAVQP